MFDYLYSDIDEDIPDFSDYTDDSTVVNNVTSMVTARESYAMELALSDYNPARNISANNGLDASEYLLGGHVPSWLVYAMFGGSTVILLNHGLRFMRKGN